MKAERRCEDFETQWLSGNRPRIESYLAEFEESQQHGLLRELLRVEIELRQRAGEKPSREEYIQRFADYAAILDDVFPHDHSRANSSPDEGPRTGRNAGSDSTIHFSSRPLASGPEQRTPFERALPTGTAPHREAADVSRNRPLACGDTIGDYELLEELPAGGMGVVYRARHKHLEKTFAIKVLSRQFMQNPEIRERFRREVRALGKVNHPHIVQASDAREEHGIHYLVMEFVEGQDLSRLVQKRGPLTPLAACELIRQSALGLAHVHGCDLVHRDIKPANLIVDSTGHLKVLDLGLASFAGNDPAAPQLTETGQLMGTADYMAPEQCLDARRVNDRSDIYSLGCTLYKLLTGEAPFSGPKFDTFTKKTVAHLQLTVPDVSEIRDDIPRRLAQLLQRMTAKDQSQRPSAAEVAAALEAYSDIDELVRFLSGAEESTQPGLTSSLIAAQGLPRTHPEFSNRQIRWVVGIALVLALLSGTSLSAAYHFAATEAWTRRFDLLGRDAVPIGFLIEGARSFVFITLVVGLIGFRFRQEFLQLLNPTWGGWTTNLFRAGVLTLIALYGCAQFVHHTSLEEGFGPAKLADWAQTHSITTTPSQERVPYAVYLPYSLVNYLLGAALTAIAAYTGVRTMRTLIHALQHLRFDLAMQSAMDDAKRAFNEFRRRCDVACLRTLDVLAVLACSVQFEYWIGARTLTESAFHRMIIAQTVMGLTIFAFLMFIWLLYWAGFNLVRESLSDQWDDELYGWSVRNGAGAFLKAVFANNVSGVVAITPLILPVLSAFTNRG